MMRSLWSGVSGLQTSQDFMDVVGNNVANVNTVGYKASQINFSDVLAQTLSGATGPQGALGGMNPMQIGLGTQVASTSKNFSQGSLQTTNVTTNLAIQGNGFFIVSPDNGNTYSYTRAGDFTFDAKGNLVTPTGDVVQGWLANNTTHLINTASTIQGINIPQNMTVPAGVTKNVSMSGNLDGGQTVQTSELTAITPSLENSTGAINMNSIYNSNGNLIGVGQTTATAAVGAGSDTVSGLYDINGNQIGSNWTVTVGGTTLTPTPATLSDLANALAPSGTTATITPGGEIQISSTGGTTLPTITSSNPVLNGILSNLSGKTIPAGGTITSLPFFSTPGDTVAMSFDGGANYNTYIYGSGTGGGGTRNSTTGIMSGNVQYFTTLDDLKSDINTDINDNSATPPINNATVTLNSSGEMQIVPTTGSNLSSIGPVYSNNSNLATILGTLSGQVQQTGSTSQPFMADTYSTSVAVYDSLGNKHDVTFNFAKTNYNPSTNHTQWEWYATAPSSGSSTPTLTNASGQITFDSTGKLVGLTPPLAITANWNNGTSQQVVNLHFGDLNTFDGLTQFSLPSQTSSLTQDGYAGGSLQNIIVNQNGVISGMFSNGKSYALGQVSLATFNNNDGLLSEGNSLFEATANSGTPIVTTAGTGTAGTVIPSELEESNVDLGTEFTNMIIAERAYQANARTLSTSDTMLQSLLNIQ
ncbi:Flagellar basal-body rod protein FlgG [Desulfurella amilsii]|uniref:Flagellar hook protein FlgE n=1 Tax=Desulfurella amilsii TaxID=1562698 RepID=A0A1X4XUS2_9BACT|nr:flagellar hook-basal body complex protein [Desulfurella amilsii]OSS41285.1 Flagellar basal-body rod protein FlgG [Desulfurella amilsii]